MTVRRQLTDADRVWNRACSHEGETLCDGDRALTALLRMHGYIMNGGVGHALDLSIREFDAGIRGYQFFGLDRLVSIIESIRANPYSSDASANEEYFRDGKDRSIKEQFERIFAERR